MHAVAIKILKRFSEQFTTDPGIYFSPGRINLIGEHIDYNDGFVLPAAIDKGIYFAVAPNQTSEIRFYAVDYHEKFTVKIQDISKQQGWINYVLAVVHEFLLAGKPVRGFDCAFGGDIPTGSGMSSSAAVEGGLAFALNDIFKFGFSRLELALLCQRAEHGFPGVNCGIMDMYANLNGKKGHVLLLDCMQLTHEYFPLSLSGYKIVLLNSKVQHVLASGEYNLRRAQCAVGLTVLQQETGIRSFRDIHNPEIIEIHKHKMSTAVYHCCRYVVEEIGRTKMAAVLLQQHKLPAVGKLMYETHAGLAKRYKVSCDELDFLVSRAAVNTNVIGARMMGAGFGGCSINIVKENAELDFIEQLSLEFKNAFKISPEAYVVDTADGTGRLQ